MGRLLQRALAGLLAAAVFAGPSAAQPFRLITSDRSAPLVQNSVIDLAAELGYFAREGVDVELVRAQHGPAAALQADEGEMANLSVDTALQLVARDGMALKAVVSPNKTLPLLIAASPEVRAPADLEGRNFGISSRGSLDEALTRQVLARNGVDVDRVDFVTLGRATARAEALADGRIDATTMSIGTWLTLPDRSGLHILVSGGDFFAAAPVISMVNVVPDRVLSERPDDVTAVVRAIVLASRDFAHHRGAWVDAMTKARPDVDPATLKMLARTFAGTWSENGGMNAAALQGTADWFYATPGFSGLRRVGFDEWVDLGPLRTVLESEGIAPENDRVGY